MAHPSIAINATATGKERQAVESKRWMVIGLFVLSSSYLNFLDRQLLAAVAPAIRKEFILTNAQYGELLAAFSLAYALCTPLFGLLVDRIGLTPGVSLAVGIWSLASSATGLIKGLPGLVACRTALGVGESAAIPCASKVTASYLPPQEYGFANAVGSIAVTLGSISAPLLVSVVGEVYGWRSVFVVSGVLGILWVLLWWLTSSRIPAPVRSVPTMWSLSKHILLDSRLWRIAFAYALVMAEYTLWMNWTTLYFVDARHLTMADANMYFAWVPPIFATLGGFFGASLAFRWIRRSLPAVRARTRVFAVSLPFLFGSALVPWLPNAGLAAVGIGLSFFACMSILTSLHVLPVDFFGVRHAAFSVAVLACSYALMQTFFSPLIGSVVDRVGFTPLCVGIPLLPFIAYFITRGCVRQQIEAR